MLPANLRRVAEFYRIGDVRDWTSLTAADVLIIDGVGRAALDKLRLHLAHRGLNLSLDHNADFWLEHLCGRLGEGDDKPVERNGVCPFTIIVDSNETFPFTFDNITDSDDKPIIVPTRREALWVRGLADYAIAGFESEFALERKGDDLAASLGQGRENFEAEISRLDSMCEFACIVIEHEWSEFCESHNGHGASIHSVARTWISWSIRYPNVSWFWMPGRAAAEQMAFSLMERFWWHQTRRNAKRKVDAITLAKLRAKV